MRAFLIAIFLWGLVSGVVAAQVTAMPFELVDEPRQVNLVRGLREISGLAMASANSVYAHNDEHGIVYEVDLADGAILRAFALGSPTVRGDFEGIAAENGRIYLVTSSGMLYEALVGEHRTRVRYNKFDTGVGAFCEVEGLSGTGVAGEFFVLCKVAKVESLYRHLVLYKWNVHDRMLVQDPWIDVSYTDLLGERGAKGFRPSAVDWDPIRKELVILSAHSRQIIIVNDRGGLVYQKAWPPELHVQAEGVVFSPSGELVIADEGQRNGSGKLSIYKLNH